MRYNTEQILNIPFGNNALAWDERSRIHGSTPTLTIPSLIHGTLDDVQIGEDIAFEEIEDGTLRSCIGLKNFVRFMHDNTRITVFDNHNHALTFWIEAVRQGWIERGFELIHIDEHSDLWSNENCLDLERAIDDTEYTWEFVNLRCNVGNYIVPALGSGLISQMIRIENEFQIDERMGYIPSKNTILNIDLDIFAPELDYIDVQKKIQLIQNLLKKCQFATIATSPYFIEQGLAIHRLHEILSRKKKDTHP